MDLVFFFLYILAITILQFKSQLMIERKYFFSSYFIRVKCQFPINFYQLLNYSRLYLQRIFFLIWDPFRYCESDLHFHAKIYFRWSILRVQYFLKDFQTFIQEPKTKICFQLFVQIFAFLFIYFKESDIALNDFFFYIKKVGVSIIMFFKLFSLHLKRHKHLYWVWLIMIYFRSHLILGTENYLHFIAKNFYLRWFITTLQCFIQFSVCQKICRQMSFYP
jgi:hypothetical protein